MENITNTVKYPYLGRSVLVLLLTSVSHYRKIQVVANELDFYDIDISTEFPMIVGWGTFGDEYILKNIRINNVTSSHRLLYLFVIGTLHLENITFSNINGAGAQSFYFEFDTQVTMKNISFTNFQSKSSANAPLIYSDIFDFSVLNIEEIYINNSTFSSSPFLESNTAPAQINIKNINIEETLIGEDSSLFSFNDIKSFLFEDITIQKTESYNFNDGNSRLFRMKSLQADASEMSEINNIVFLNSSVSLITLESISGSPSEKVTVLMKNISYSD